jgi:hypothetical protein
MGALIINSPTAAYAILTLWALVFIALRMWHWRQSYVRIMDRVARVVMELVQSMAISVVIVVVGSFIDNLL